jgi:adenine-specific DNA-methyltransferase
VAASPKKPLDVEALRHDAAKRKNIPTAEFESVMREEEKSPIRLAYARRNRDLDPQLVWRGKDEQDWSDLIVQAPPLYIQEKVHPKVIIEDLRRESKKRADRAAPPAPDLFADFNGLKDKEAATEFYQHDQHWSNRMISGDSLSVMASLAEREGLRGKVQCVYFDPPYGIKFNSNFQWSTTSRDIKDGAKDQITREPEQVRAFRDTWRDGIHSYLTYLRDRLMAVRDLLHESGSIFVQIGDENVHRMRTLMEEVFGEENFCGQIMVQKTSGAGSPAIGTDVLAAVTDYVIWFSRSKEHVKYRQLYREKILGEEGTTQYVNYRDQHSLSDLRLGSIEGVSEAKNVFASDNLTSPTGAETTTFKEFVEGQTFQPKKGGWKTNQTGMNRLAKALRLKPIGNTLMYRRYLKDFGVSPINNLWRDVLFTGFAEDKIYVVQSAQRLVQRCILMTTGPGDLVLDPTCGSGTTATVAEQWGRRWITIDTSRVAVALARSRLMGSRYPYYLLADSPEGQKKESEISRTPPKSTTTRGDIRMGFVYDRVPHITLKSIANNAEIDVIWNRHQPAVDAARDAVNSFVVDHPVPFKIELGGRSGTEIDFRLRGEIKLPSGELAPTGGLMEWEIPREAPNGWSSAAKAALARFWEARLARQREIDGSIAAKADFEYLYDKPYVDNGRVRVAGPFTVESLSPHRMLAVDWDDELIDLLDAKAGDRAAPTRDYVATDFTQMILENLKTAGVQQAHKENRITFTSLTGWPGRFICAEAKFMEREQPRRAGIFVGPEFGTVSRPDLVAAAREAGDAGFDLLIACAFNYDAHSTEFDKLGRVPVLKARMNPDLHMGNDLKTTTTGNLFVVFGEPDIRIEDAGDNQIRVKVFGVDVFKPQTGEVVSEGTDGIALWMLDTDYNEESFFVRHAYFLGANDPYKALKTTLKAEIDPEAWQSLYSDTSRPFPKPASGRIAVKVINHLGDEVMKIFKVI